MNRHVDKVLIKLISVRQENNNIFKQYCKKARIYEANYQEFHHHHHRDLMRWRSRCVALTHMRWRCTVLSRLFLRLVSGISRQITMSRLLLLRRPLISGQGPDNALFWWLSWPSPGELHKRGYKGKLELPNWILRIIQRTFLAIDMGLNVHRRLQLRTKRIFHKIYVYRGRVWILFLRALNMEY